MTRVHAADGSLLGRILRASGASICPRRPFPPLVKNAFIAAEDKNFYTHRGFDPEGILRAGVVFLQGIEARAGRFDDHPAGRQELPA